MKNLLSKTARLLKTGLLLIILIHGCQQVGNENRYWSEDNIPPVEIDLTEIQKRGSLVALVDNTTTSYFIYKGKPMGFEYELLLQLADDLGVALEIRQESDLKKAFQALNSGEADILAYNLAVTKERSRKVAFTNVHYESRQVLVQRKPEGWRSLNAERLEKSLIRNVIQLGGEEIHIRPGSAYYSRLSNLSEEIGSDLIIKEVEGSLGMEELIQMVSAGEIKFTIADESYAQLMANLYPDIDIKTPVSFQHGIAWATRHNAPQLLNATNEWLGKTKKTASYAILFDKYYNNSYAHAYRVRSSYSSIRGERISVFDEQIKEAADRLGWDWRLLAAQIYQESKFETEVESWAGAQGLMQLVPATAERFGAEDPFNPIQSLNAGVKYIEYLNRFWMDRITDPNERIKFILASYNAGQGHVLDAFNLAKKYESRAEKWSEVEGFLLKKMEPKYYMDPVVKSGYVRANETVKYVKEVSERFVHYKQHFR
jgi:membrane-bound lytic murein transglycosylase F